MTEGAITLTVAGVRVEGSDAGGCFCTEALRALYYTVMYRDEIIFGTFFGGRRGGGGGGVAMLYEYMWSVRRLDVWSEGFVGSLAWSR